MSAIVVIPILIPAAWPAIAAAAAAAATALGFAAAKGKAKTSVKSSTEVELAVSNSEAFNDEVALGEQLTFAKGDIQITFFRNSRGKVGVKVRGSGKTEEQLRTIGQQAVNGLTQQYAYHRLVTELKKQNFTVVDEKVEADGTVRLQVRTFKD